MKGTYRVTEDDYVAALRLSAGFSWRQQAMFSAIAIAFVLLSLHQGYGGWRFLAVLMGVTIATSLFCRYFLLPAIWRRHYRKYKLAHEELALELREDGLTISSPSSHTNLAWDKILKWRHNDHYVLIYKMPRLAEVVPKSIQQSGFDISALTGKLAEQVGNPD